MVGKHEGGRETQAQMHAAQVRRAAQGRPALGKHGHTVKESYAEPIALGLRPGQSFSERMAEIWDGGDAA